MSSILTVGYASRSLDELIALLQRERVEFLIDVRSNPQSGTKPEFSGKPLETALRAASVKYVFMGDSLGGRPSDPSCYENGFVVYDLVREKPFFQAGIDRLMQACAQGLGVCLLCSEPRPEDCHRTKLIAVALADRGVTVIHLEPNGERADHAAVLARLEKPQAELFGNDLTSRKAYRAG